MKIVDVQKLQLPRRIMAVPRELRELGQLSLDFTHDTREFLSQLRDDYVGTREQLEQLQEAVAAAGGGGSVTFGTPVALDVGNGNVDGVSTSAARADHEHAIAKGSPVALTAGGTALDGSSGNFADASHRHAAPTSAPATLVVGGSAVTGSSGNFSDADHKHALPAFGTSAGQFAEGNHSHAAISGGYFDTWNPDAPPVSAHAHDDEGTGGSGWTNLDTAGFLTFGVNATRKRYEVSGTGNSTTRLGFRYRAIPATEFQAVARVGAFSTGNVKVGLFVAEDLAANPTTADIRAGTLSLTTGLSNHASIDVSTHTAYNATAVSVIATPQGLFSYLRLRVNNTTIAFDISQDGRSWMVANSATGITPATYGFVFHLFSNGVAATGWFDWLRVLSGAGSSAFAVSMPGRLQRVLLA